MADAIKSVVVEIETKLQGNAIDNLNKGLRTADSLSEELARQIQVVDKAIQSTNAKRLKINGTDTSKKELQELSNALKLAAQDFDQLSDIQKNTLAALLKENAKVVESLENTAQASDGAKQGAEGYLRAINVLTPLLGQHGVAISLVVSNYLEYVQASKKGEAASTQLGGALSLLRNKYVAIAAAATAVIGVGLNDYFRNTQEGADGLDKALKGTEFTLRGLVTSFSRLVTGDFRGALESIKDVFSGRAFERGQEVSVALDGLFDRIQKIKIENALYNLDISEGREIISEQAQSLDDILKKRRELSKISQTETKILENNLKAAEDEYNILLKSAAARFGVDEQRLRTEIEAGIFTTVNDQEAEKLVDALVKIVEARDQYATNRRRLNKIEKSVNNEDKALQKEFQDIVKGLIKQSQELEIADPFNLAKIITEENRIEAQNRLREGFDKISEDFKTLSRILGVEDILTLKPDQIARLERKYNLVGGTIFNAVARGVANQNAVKGLFDAVFEAREVQNIAKLPGVQKTVTDISKQIQEAVNVTNNLPQQEKASVLERIFGISDDEKKKIGDLLQQAQNDIIAAANTFYDTEIQKTDFLIREQEKRIEETTRLASLGNAEQLQLEQERLNKLLEERRKFEQAQAAINAAAAISATAVAASTFAASITKESLSTTPLVAIANSIALVAAIGAGIAQISALASGFEKGTEYLTPGQKSNKGKTDTIPAWLAPGERVVPAMINEQLKGIKNADLPKLVAAGKMALEGYGQLNTSITSNSYGFTSEAVGILKDLKQGIAEIPRALSDQIVDINFDHYGYVIQQRRVSRHAQKVKALTR